MTNIAIFASGTGTNFDAIIKAIEDKRLDATCTLMVCDHLDAKVIEKAKNKNITSFVFNPKDYQSKEQYENEIVEKCKDNKVDLIVLAGYMRILSNVLLDAYPNKIINIHPSLLPAFKGKDAIGQAFNYGVKVMGVSIHYVNSEMDGGKIIAQQSFDVPNGATHEDVEKMVHDIEHVLYPRTLQQIIEGGI